MAVRQPINLYRLAPAQERHSSIKIVEEINKLSLDVTSIAFEIGGEAYYRVTFKTDAAGQIRKVRFTGSAPGDVSVNWLGYFDVDGQLVMADYKDCFGTRAAARRSVSYRSRRHC